MLLKIANPHAKIVLKQAIRQLLVLCDDSSNTQVNCVFVIFCTFFIFNHVYQKQTSRHKGNTDPDLKKPGL